MVISEDLRTAGGNAIYTSRTSQLNQAMCENLIQQQILDNIKEARFFSVIADEATDVARYQRKTLHFNQIYLVKLISLVKSFLASLSV